MKSYEIQRLNWQLSSLSLSYTLWAFPLFTNQKILKNGEQDDRGVGGYGVRLSPWIYQEYTFRHRGACRKPAESGQEYLTSGKEYIEPCKTRQDKGTRGEKQEC